MPPTKMLLGRIFLRIIITDKGDVLGTVVHFAVSPFNSLIKAWSNFWFSMLRIVCEKDFLVIEVKVTFFRLVFTLT